ncbi:hypothetical protein V1478_014559 [Vespula squamosa]|uniref:Uncharacterized protein n=1 Tax=Vespula squamosa TaxID=30214 RepID=A0ABD2A8C2_VESSQ
MSAKHDEKKIFATCSEKNLFLYGFVSLALEDKDDNNNITMVLIKLHLITLVMLKVNSNIFRFNRKVTN